MATLFRTLRPFSSRFTTSTLPRLTLSQRRFISSDTASAAQETPNEEYPHLLLTHPRPGVSLITLNRPKALNSLSTPLIISLNRCLHDLDTSPTTRAIVLTGSDKAFAAGADIKEMSSLTFSSAYGTDFIKNWSSQIPETTKPIIAAVNGFALGGGCELALMCDIIYAGPKAKFGQPEVKLGVIPGAGGSQRLVRAIGKGRAMEMILTGRLVDVQEAEGWGIVAKSFDSPKECLDKALDTAEVIAGYGRLAIKAAKEVVNTAEEVGLSEGVKFERRVFHGLFASRDQKIGMEAFVKKEQPEWTHE